MAKNTIVDTVGDDSRPGVANVSSANKEGHRAVRAATAGFFHSSFSKDVTQTVLNAVTGRYVFENMLLLSTGDSDYFRALIGKIPGRAGAGPPCKKDILHRCQVG